MMTSNIQQLHPATCNLHVLCFMLYALCPSTSILWTVVDYSRHLHLEQMKGVLQAMKKEGRRRRRRTGFFCNLNSWFLSFLCFFLKKAGDERLQLGGGNK